MAIGPQSLEWGGLSPFRAGQLCRLHRFMGSLCCLVLGHHGRAGCFGTPGTLSTLVSQGGRAKWGIPGTSSGERRE